MIVFKQVVWTLSAGIDEWRTEVKGHFTTQEEALKLIKGIGWYGGDGVVSGPTELIVKVFETAEEYKDSLKKDKRQEAINKLTLEERKLLNLE